jgi:hypothetical protein
VRLAKEAMLGADKPLNEGLADEAWLFQRLLRTGEAQANMRTFLEIGGQKRDGELKVGELGGQLGDRS